VQKISYVKKRETKGRTLNVPQDGCSMVAGVLRSIVTCRWCNIALSRARTCEAVRQKDKGGRMM
jgi:hypothetical protein